MSESRTFFAKDAGGTKPGEMKIESLYVNTTGAAALRWRKQAERRVRTGA
ncbi:MAG: hypothetical protein PUE85_09295 [Firmicutes bacterium]|nr:hypothetical protein [Bacillota bacterium]